MSHNPRELAHTQMTFGEHLEELRGRIIKALLASLAGLVGVFFYHAKVFALVVAPYRKVMLALNEKTSLVATAPAQPFFAHIKVAFIVGMMLTAPIWIYQLWAFIGAGLYAKEKRIVYKLVPLCLLLFISGVLFGYFAMIPFGLRYLLTFADPSTVQNFITIPEYLKLFTLLTLMMGVAFQLPVVMLGLVKTGIMQVASFRKKRKLALIIIFVLAAFFTPPDPFTQIMLAIPLIGLYELGITLAWLSLGKKRPPVNWKALWGLLRKLLIILGLLFVFRQPLYDYWQRQKVDRQLVQPGDGSHPPIRSICSTWLGVQVEGVFRVEQRTGESLWVVRALQKIWCLDLKVRRVATQIMDRSVQKNGSHRLDFANYPQKKVVYRLVMRASVPYREFVPGLLRALALGSDDVRGEVRRMLVLISSQDPPGGGGQALKVFQAWFQREHQGLFRQALGHSAAKTREKKR